MDRQKKHSKEKIACKSYTWTTVTNFKLLGIIFSVDLDKCPELNYSVKKAKIKESISQWNKRYLTPLGKVTVIKTFLMSKINHLFTTLPDPKEKFINEINDIFFKFLWSGKPDKINRKTVELENKNGGINMINFRNSIISLKATWVRRLITNQSYSKPLWIELFEKMYNTNITKFTNFGTFYPVILKKRSNNLFWKNTFDAWIKISNKQEIKNGTDLLTSPLWYNTEMSYQEMYLPTWYEKGIVTVADVINDLGTVMDLDTLKRVYGINTINPLHYLRVQQNVKEFLKKYRFGQSNRVERPFVPFYVKILYENKKGASVFNRLIKKKDKNGHSMKDKWQVDLNIRVDDTAWKNIFNSCYKSLCNNTLVWFQIKVLYRVIGTRNYLYKLHLVDSSKCVYCGENETIVHMFVECENVKKIWHLLEEYIYKTIRIDVIFGKLDILFGYRLNNQNKIPVDAIILNTKKYIYDTNFKSNNSPCYIFEALKYRFQQTYQDEQYLAIINNRKKKFNDVWFKWIPVFLGNV